MHTWASRKKIDVDTTVCIILQVHVNAYNRFTLCEEWMQQNLFWHYQNNITQPSDEKSKKNMQNRGFCKVSILQPLRIEFNSTSTNLTSRSTFLVLLSIHSWRC